MAEPNVTDGNPPFFVGSTKQLETLVSWFDDFTQIVTKPDYNLSLRARERWKKHNFNMNLEKSYDYDLEALNRVLLDGRELSGIFNPAAGVLFSRLIQKMLEDMPAILARESGADRDFSTKSRRILMLNRQNLYENIEFSAPYFQLYGVKARRQIELDRLALQGIPGDTNTDDTGFIFRKNGTVFYIEGFGERGAVHDLKGFRQIFRLIQTPGRSVLMLELVEAGDDERIAADQRSKQPLLDSEGNTKIYKKIQSEKADLEKYKRNNDNAQAQLCEEQIEKLAEYLRKATGLGGRDRNLNANHNRLRPKISGTLSTAYKKLYNADPSMKKLAEHFESSIFADGTGTSFIYQPALTPSPEWRIESKK